MSYLQREQSCIKHKLICMINKHSEFKKKLSWSGTDTKDENMKITFSTYRSHCRSVQEAIIHKDTMKTNSTVPGHIVIKVFNTNLFKERKQMLMPHPVFQNWSMRIRWFRKKTIYLVLKLILFKAPILRDEASVKSFEWSSITRQIKYKRKNMGSEKATSYGTFSVPKVLFLFANFVVQ